MSKKQSGFGDAGRRKCEERIKQELRQQFKELFDELETLSDDEERIKAVHRLFDNRADKYGWEEIRRQRDLVIPLWIEGKSWYKKTLEEVATAANTVVDAQATEIKEFETVLSQPLYTEEGLNRIVTDVVHQRDQLAIDTINEFEDYTYHYYALKDCIERITVDALRFKGDLLRISLGFAPFDHRNDLEIDISQPSMIKTLGGTYLELMSLTSKIDPETHRTHLAFFEPIFSDYVAEMHSLRVGKGKLGEDDSGNPIKGDNGERLRQAAKQRETEIDRLFELYRSTYKKPGVAVGTRTDELTQLGRDFVVAAKTELKIDQVMRGDLERIRKRAKILILRDQNVRDQSELLGIYAQVYYDLENKDGSTISRWANSPKSLQ
jgi:hypothetical protein